MKSISKKLLEIYDSHPVLLTLVVAVGLVIGIGVGYRILGPTFF